MDPGPPTRESKPSAVLLLIGSIMHALETKENFFSITVHSHHMTLKFFFDHIFVIMSLPVKSLEGTHTMKEMLVHCC